MTSQQVLITGATGKIGRVLASAFAHAGWEVIVTSRSQERVEELVQALRAVSPQPHYGFVFESTATEAAAPLLDQIRSHGLRPCCLINNARNLENLKVGPNGMPSAAQWALEFQIGVVAAYELTLGLATLETTRLESVVNVASMYGVVAPNQRLYTTPATQSPIHYGVAKAALIHLTKELAVRLAPRKIRVNAISYGGVEGRVAPDFLERYSALCPQERMLTTADLAGPALFLAGAGASGTTGHNLVVDGGWSAW
jgi:NAD(P)-dependent dehydrogenase (short-subunit alcohol dehydrogenase family)